MPVGMPYRPLRNTGRNIAIAIFGIITMAAMAGVFISCEEADPQSPRPLITTSPTDTSTIKEGK